MSGAVAMPQPGLTGLTALPAPAGGDVVRSPFEDPQDAAQQLAEWVEGLPDAVLQGYLDF